VEARIEDVEIERLINEAAAYTQDHYFGLNQGQLTDIADMGILGYVMMHSQRVVDALAAYRRYNVILCSGYNLDWEDQGDSVCLRFYKLNASRMSRHCMEDMASSLYHMIVRMSNRAIPVQELQFMHTAPSDLTPYLSVFGVEPRFSCKDNFMRLSKEVLQYPILYSDPRLKRAFEPIAEEIKGRLMRGRAFSDRVYQWMIQCMPAYFPTLQQTAEHFHMSARSLQAKLKEEHASYNEIAASARKELAMAYLDRGEYAIGEIAYLLHYSEPSAFQNAFKKWTGLTPGQYRERSTQNIRMG
jgi:AraC-like DNA-binding protein